MADLYTDKDKKNKQILDFLKEKNYIPSYDDISEELGLSKGYVSKLGNTANENNKIDKRFTILLEYLYKIPQNIFFNKDISNKKETIPYIDSFRENIEKKIIDYNYIYTLADNKKITKYKIIYKKSHIELKINNEVRYIGHIFDKFGTEIVIIVNHVIRKTTSTLILERNEILNAIVPICITSRDPLGEQKRLLYFGIISQKEIADEKIISILKDNDDTQNRDMRLIISKRT